METKNYKLIEQISERLLFDIRAYNNAHPEREIDLDDIVNFLMVDYKNPYDIEY